MFTYKLMVHNCKFTREIQGMWRYLNILIDGIDRYTNAGKYGKKSTFSIHHKYLR